MKEIKMVLKEHVENLENIFNMAIREMKKEYSGTVLSYFWAVLKNVIFVMAYWFAIAVGLRGGKSIGYPYMAWLITGLWAWFLIKDSLASSSKSIRQNKFLVTKMIFPVSTIPTYKVLSKFIANLMFFPIVLIILLFSKVNISIHWIQIIYYQLALVSLLIVIAWLTSALVVVSRDIEMFISSTVFVLFWITPILFPISNVSGKLGTLLKINPFYYIVEGFRASFLYGEWFWERPVLTLYYWAVVLFFFMFGAFIHGKLRKQFVDIL